MHTKFTYSTHAVEIVQTSYLGFKEKGLQKRAITDIHPNTRYKHTVRLTKTNYHFVMKIAKHCYK